MKANLKLIITAVLMIIPIICFSIGIIISTSKQKQMSFSEQLEQQVADIENPYNYEYLHGLNGVTEEKKDDQIYVNYNGIYSVFYDTGTSKSFFRFEVTDEKYRFTPGEFGVGSRSEYIKELFDGSTELTGLSKINTFGYLVGIEYIVFEEDEGVIKKIQIYYGP